LPSPSRPRPSELALGLLLDGLGHAGLFDLRAVLLDDRRIVVAELLADRLHLLAQQVLALLLLGAGLDVVADAAADLGLGQRVALGGQCQPQALDDVQLLQQLHLLLEGQVGGVAGAVGQGAGIGDRAEERRDAAVIAAQLELLLHHRAVLLLQLAGLDGRRDDLLVLLDGDAEPAVGVCLGRPEDGALLRDQRDGGDAARQPGDLHHVGQHADLGVLAVLGGHQQDALVVADVDRQGDVHIGEDNGVFEWDEQIRGHGWKTRRDA